MQVKRDAAFRARKLASLSSPPPVAPGVKPIGKAVTPFPPSVSPAVKPSDSKGTVSKPKPPSAPSSPPLSPVSSPRPPDAPRMDGVWEARYREAVTQRDLAWRELRDRRFKDKKAAEQKLIARREHLQAVEEG